VPGFPPPAFYATHEMTVTCNQYVQSAAATDDDDDDDVGADSAES